MIRIKQFKEINDSLAREIRRLEKKYNNAFDITIEHYAKNDYNLIMYNHVNDDIIQIIVMLDPYDRIGEYYPQNFTVSYMRRRFEAKTLTELVNNLMKIILR